MGYTYDSVSNSQSNQYDDYLARDDTVEDDYFTSDNQGRNGAVEVTTKHSGNNKNGKSFKSKSDKKGDPSSRIGKSHKSKYPKSKPKPNGQKMVDKAISTRYDVQYDDTTEMDDDIFRFQP